MSALSFDDFAYHAWSTSYFLDEYPIEKQRSTIFYGFNEEVTELLTDATHPKELTAMLWGRVVDKDIALKLSDDKTSEAGDVLFYLTAMATARNISLTKIMQQSVDRFTGNSLEADCSDFIEFDAAMNGLIGEPVPDDYRPDYRKWKLWDFAPFENSLDIVLREPEYAKGPLKLIGDGRYALERLHTNVGQYILPERIDEERFTASAALALGGLSVVLQHRFDSSLTAAAQNNVDKRERRALQGKLKSGDDVERSRGNGPRPKLDLGFATDLNLLNAAQPDIED